MTKKVIKSIVLISLVLISLSFSLLSLAEDRKLEVKYPEILGLKPETVSIGLPEYVKYVFNLVIILSGFILFGALLWGGIVYLTAGGKSEKLKEGKDRIISAFLGIIILLSSYIILASINPQLVIFNLPPLTPPAEVEAPEVLEVKPEDVSLIVLEIPLGQAIDKKLWAKNNRTETEDLVKSNDVFLTQEIVINKGTADEKKFNRIPDLNKYLESLTNQCHCELLTALCTKPVDCSLPVRCTGDPCPEKVRRDMTKILAINKEKIKGLLDFQKKALEKKVVFETALSKFGDIEQEMIACEEQTKLLFNLNEHLSRMNYYNEQGWKLERLTIPDAPSPLGDALTFYCSVGGTIFDYPYIQERELYPELTQPFTGITEAPEELTVTGELSCPVEFPLGMMVDEIRELAVLLSFKLEKLAHLNESFASRLDSMGSLVGQCNSSNCQVECKCVPNLCPICGIALRSICETPSFGPVPNPCYRQCSPCTQTVGGCTCGEGSNACPCPKEEIEKILDNKKKGEEGIKQIEENIFATIREIELILAQVSSLLGEDPENPWNLKNIREGIKLCYSSSIEEPIWSLMDCASSVGNFGPDDRSIGDCHPRNFFCCSLSEEIKFPWKPPVPPKEPAFSIPAKKYAPLPEGEKGCPQGWLCDESVKSYNQYSDASEPLEGLLSCMRDRLDKTKVEKELPDEETIGRISSISDSKLHEGTCTWENGPQEPGGCSHTYEIKYGKERISAHYGGPTCRYQKESYALDLGDEEYADYLIAAAKECRPDAFILSRAPGHYDHLHISIGQAENCGAN